MTYGFLTAENALIWRIVRRSDVPSLIRDGLYSGNHVTPDDNYKTIGNEDLIKKRNTRPVPIGSGGVLNDYVPFYFTPFSPMMYNIHTGHGGIKKLDNEEIVILVSNLNKLKNDSVDLVFTDRHAYMSYAEFYSDLQHLDKIDWSILQERDFQYDINDLKKMERYQAEALIYRHLPIVQLDAILCYSENVKIEIEDCLSQHGIDMTVVVAKNRYF